MPDPPKPSVSLENSDNFVNFDNFDNSENSENSDNSDNSYNENESWVRICHFDFHLCIRILPNQFWKSFRLGRYWKRNHPQQIQALLHGGQPSRQREQTLLQGVPESSRRNRRQQHQRYISMSFSTTLTISNKKLKISYRVRNIFVFNIKQTSVQRLSR